MSFDNTTPRPWYISGFEVLSGGASRVVMGADRFSIAHINDRSALENAADAALIVAAVNAYDPAREALIAELVTTLEWVSKNYAAGSTAEINQKIASALAKARNSTEVTP